MKPILTLLAAALAAGNLNAQLLPLTPAEQQIASIDRSAAGAKYYAELYAQSLARLHGEIFITNDETLAAMLAKVGPQKSTELVELYFACATSINTVLEGVGSSVRAPVTRTREWVWSGDSVTITPLPEPTPEPTPDE